MSLQSESPEPLTLGAGRVDLRVERRAIKRSDLKPEVMPMLTGQVFHVTSMEALEGIQRAGSLMSNQDGRFGFTFPQSKNSYGPLTMATGR